MQQRHPRAVAEVPPVWAKSGPAKEQPDAERHMEKCLVDVVKTCAMGRLTPAEVDQYSWEAPSKPAGIDTIIVGYKYRKPRGHLGLHRPPNVPPDRFSDPEHGCL